MHLKEKLYFSPWSASLMYDRAVQSVSMTTTRLTSRRDMLKDNWLFMIPEGKHISQGNVLPEKTIQKNPFSMGTNLSTLVASGKHMDRLSGNLRHQVIQMITHLFIDGWPTAHKLKPTIYFRFDR